ncbi:MAG: hypothetical protein AAF961_11270, partial [Planctomycetota bacterium]
GAGRAGQPGSWRPDADLLNRLRWRTLLAGLGFAVLSGAALFGLSSFVILRTFHVVREAREAANFDEAFRFAVLWENVPELFLASGSLLGTGLISGLAGIWLIKATLGPKRAPPKLLILLFAGMPTVMVSFAAFSTAPAGVASAMIVTAMGLAWAAWMTPIELGVLAFFSLSVARKQALERQAFVATEELPVEATEYFDEVEPAMLEAGMDRMGDLHYPPTKGKCRRLWANPSQTVFASAVWFPASGGVISSFTVYSVLENGEYYEGSNMTLGFTAPPGHESQFDILPDANPKEVLERHFEKLRKCVREFGVRPMRVSREEQEHLCHYGLHYVMRGKRTGSPCAGLLWLADPHLGFDAPPIPGRPWLPEEGSMREPSLSS